MKYKVRFAGSTLELDYIKKDKLNDGTSVYLFKDEVYTYPIRKKDILCGNFKP